MKENDFEKTLELLKKLNLFYEIGSYYCDDEIKGKYIHIFEQELEFQFPENK